MGIKIDIDYDVADEVTVAVLRDMLQGIAKEINELIIKSGRVPLKKYEYEDYVNHIEDLVSVKRTLKYMTRPSEHKEIDDMLDKIITGT